MGKPRRNKANKVSLEAIENQHEAVRLRKLGYRYKDIAARMGVSMPTAYKYVMRALERQIAELNEATDEVRELELLRLDDLLQKILTRMDVEDDTDVFTRAADRVLKIMDRRSKYLGLDAPARQEIATKFTTENSVDISQMTPEQIVQSYKDQTK